MYFQKPLYCSSDASLVELMVLWNGFFLQLCDVFLWFSATSISVMFARYAIQQHSKSLSSSSWFVVRYILQVFG